MAKYCSDFLVPYLRSICALHMTEYKLKEYYKELSEEEIRLEKGKFYSEPPKRPLEVEVGCGTYFCLGFGGFLIFLVLLAFFGSFSQGAFNTTIIVVTVLLGGLGAFLIYGGLQNVKDVNYQNEKYRKEHETEVIRYQMNLKNNETMRAFLPAVREKKTACANEQRKIQRLLTQAYSINIIPNRYRSMYPAVFLYEWFRSSQSTDLDHALSMYVLEEIKSRLDKIIENQNEMIINQEIMIANHRRSYDQQQKYINDMRNKMNRMRSTQDEMNNHMKMIAAETQTSAYFATADFIKNIL